MFSRNAARATCCGQGGRARLAVYLVSVLTLSVSAVASDVTYTYDSHGRVETATYRDGATVTGTVTYSYDANGNRTGAVTSGVTRGTLSFAAASYSGGEAGSQRAVSIAVKRTGGSSGEARVSYATSDGSATAAGGDYVPATGTLVWPNGDASPKTLTVTILDDTATELAESFVVTLSGAAGASLGSPASATVIIDDDDADVAPPSVPMDLALIVQSSTRIDVSWASSTDNIGVTGYELDRCHGASCSGFDQIAAPTGTSYSDTAAAASTSYSYRVRARDAAGNRSEYSAVGTATTDADTVAPTAPSNLIVLASGTTVDLTWAGSTDSGGSGLAGYKIERCTGANCADVPANFVQIGTSTTTGFSDADRSAATTYMYRVRAYDNAAPSNHSSYTPAVSITTAADGTRPTNPSDLSTGAVSSTSIDLSWSASTDTGGSGLAGYRIERCQGTACSTFVQIDASTVNSYSDTACAPLTTYRYRVRAYDGADNLSLDYSNIASGTTAADTEAPSAPANVAASIPGSTQIDLRWDASIDQGGAGLAGYELERCQGANCSNFAALTTLAASATSYSNTELPASTTFVYRLRAFDGASPANPSAFVVVTATTQADTEVPSRPADLSASAISGTQIDLNWTGSTDSGGTNLAGYEIERCAGSGCTSYSQIATTSAASFTNSGLVDATSYSYRVRAYDGASPPNRSQYSNIATTATPDVTAPTPPGGPSVSNLHATSATVSWGAASDNVGVTGYEYQVGGGNPIATGLNRSANLSGLTVNTSYTVNVRAIDAAGNVSNTAAVSFTTVDNTAPTAPGAPGFSSIAATTATASWTPASDDVGVTGYQYHLNSDGWQWLGNATSVGLSGLICATNYTLEIQARDAAGNWGASRSGSFTTLDGCAPGAPGVPSFSSIGLYSATASWAPASDNVAVTGYRYSVNSGAWQPLGNVTSVALSGLAAGTQYTFEVQARDAAGSWSSSSASSFRTTVPTITIADRQVVSVGQGGATASYRLYSSGDIFASPSSVPAADVDVGDWLSPKSDTGLFRVRATRESSTACNSGTFGSWIGFGAAWTVSVTGTRGVTRNCVFRVDIAAASDLNSILGTARIVIQAVGQ